MFEGLLIFIHQLQHGRMAAALPAPLKVLLAQTVVSLSNAATYRIRIQQQQQQLFRSVPTLNQAKSILFYYFKVGL